MRIFVLVMLACVSIAACGKPEQSPAPAPTADNVGFDDVLPLPDLDPLEGRYMLSKSGGTYWKIDSEKAETDSTELYITPDEARKMQGMGHTLIPKEVDVSESWQVLYDNATRG